jgi:hypothetical protein
LNDRQRLRGLVATREVCFDEKDMMDLEDEKRLGDFNSSIEVRGVVAVDSDILCELEVVFRSERGDATD